jgi:hypothetical protein
MSELGSFSEVGPSGCEVCSTPRTDIVGLIAQVRKVPPGTEVATSFDHLVGADE